MSMRTVSARLWSRARRVQRRWWEALVVRAARTSAGKWYQSEFTHTLMIRVFPKSYPAVLSLTSPMLRFLHPRHQPSASTSSCCIRYVLSCGPKGDGHTAWTSYRNKCEIRSAIPVCHPSLRGPHPHKFLLLAVGRIALHFALQNHHHLLNR
jgi:hypothetical protein